MNNFTIYFEIQTAVAKLSHFRNLNKLGRPWQNLDCRGKIKPSLVN